MANESELDDALKLADKLLDEPNADPDDDLRVLARQLQREHEAHARYERTLWRANGRLMQLDLEPEKLASAQTVEGP
jgi:hypothetical protein